MYTGIHVKYPLFFSNFNKTWIFSTDFQKTFVIFNENPFSGRPVFHADGQTDKTKLTVAFRNFVNAPKKTKEAKLTKQVTI